MPHAQAGAIAVGTESTGSASGAVVFSQFFWPSALRQFTGLLADGTSLPMATVHFAAMTGALLAGWMTDAGQGLVLLNRVNASLLVRPSASVGNPE